MAGKLQPPTPSVRHTQTHMVMVGRLKFSGYQDGDVIRSLSDGATLARRRGDGTWSKPVKESRATRGRWDDVKPSGPAVQVNLKKGEFY